MDTMKDATLPAARLLGGASGAGPGLGPRMARQRARRMALGLMDLLVVWQQRMESRACLQAMNDARLRDIGLTRLEVRCESDKPFWRR
ncbi:DUF1127 domain-containing protein [Pelagibius sp. CAU 1746]|uniref:DUF1127 domain-containing protein n=1 Tax=Pelagibius sp. CAU 1746 TaxID=3140370 RepID=UPI00325C176E